MSDSFTKPPVAAGACERFLQKIGKDTDLPTLGASVARVVQLTSSDNEAVHNLACLVLSDVGLTQKLLRLSNTAIYRTVTGGKPITTISRAIFLLGFDTIKTSALAMLLVDGMANGKHAQNVRGELAQALYASVVGRSLARRSHYQDAEEAAIAALFKNLGRLLVAAYDHDAYSEITTLIQSGSHRESQAAMQVLGCRFEPLAETVLRGWEIPDSIVRALVSPLPRTLRVAQTRLEWMQQVTEFSAEAARLIPALSAGEVDPIEVAALCRPLLERFGAALNLDQDKLHVLFLDAAQEIRTLVDSMDLPLLAPALPPVAVPTACAAPDLPSELLMLQPSLATAQAAARHASGKPGNARELLLAGVQDVTQMMASGRCKTNELILLVLETIYHSMGFRFATVCVKDPKSGQFRARVALGEQNAVRQAGFAFPIASTRDLFHLALENDADLMISDATIGKIHELIPAWHQALLPDARSFILLPLVVQKQPFGLFYADRAQLAPEGVPPDEAALIKILKGQVLAALTQG